MFLLRILKQNGIEKESLVKLYKAQIRSIIEYGASAIFPLLNDGQFRRLERLQSICLKTCHNFYTKSESLREMFNIPLIKERFQDLTDNMIKKEFESNKMGWFREREQIEYINKLRNPRCIEENQTKTAKEFAGPISYYRRRINHLHQVGIPIVNRD